jgi:hypothetical protein
MTTRYNEIKWVFEENSNFIHYRKSQRKEVKKRRLFANADSCHGCILVVTDPDCLASKSITISYLRDNLITQP